MSPGPDFDATLRAALRRGIQSTAARRVAKLCLRALLSVKWLMRGYFPQTIHGAARAEVQTVWSGQAHQRSALRGRKPTRRVAARF